MKKCDWCEEPLEKGLTCIVPHVGGDKPYLLFHVECQKRQFFGSVAHIGGYCSCKIEGSSCNDPPHMTRREAAKAAVAAWESLHSVSGP